MVVIEWWGRGPYRAREVLLASVDEVARLTTPRRPHVLTTFRHAMCGPSEGPRGLAMRLVPTTCIDLTKEPDDLLKRMSGSCRYEIRVAERLGDRLRISSDWSSAASDFLALHTDFMQWRRFGRPMTPYRLRRYMRSSDLFVAYLDGKPLSGHLVVRDGARRRTRMHVSASARHHGGEGAKWSAAANRYLHWHEILFYRSAGFLVYDFGGFIEDQNGPSSVGYFKLPFGGYREEGRSFEVAGSLPRASLKLKRLAAAGRRALAS